LCKTSDPTLCETGAAQIVDYIPPAGQILSEIPFRIEKRVRIASLRYAVSKIVGEWILSCFGNVGISGKVPSGIEERAEILHRKWYLQLILAVVLASRRLLYRGSQHGDRVASRRNAPEEPARCLT